MAEKDGYIDEAPAPSRKPEPSGIQQDEMGFWDRLGASYDEAVQHGFPGLVARKAFDWTDQGKDLIRQKFPKASPEQLEKLSDELIAQTQRDAREDAAKRLAADPTWKPDETWYGNILSGRWAPYLTGQILGSPGPESFIMPGASAVPRIVGQGALGAGSDIAYQGADIYDKVADEYNPWQTLLATVAGAGFQGALEIPGAVKNLLGKLGLGNFEPKVATPAEVDAFIKDNPNFTAEDLQGLGVKNAEAVVKARDEKGVIGRTVAEKAPAPVEQALGITENAPEITVTAKGNRKYKGIYEDIDPHSGPAVPEDKEFTTWEVGDPDRRAEPREPDGFVEEQAAPAPVELTPEEKTAARRVEMKAATEALADVPKGEFRTVKPYESEPDYHRFATTTDDGKRVTGYYTYDGGGKIDNFKVEAEGGVERSVGPKDIRAIAKKIKEAHPEAETLSGYRLGGARANTGKGGDYVEVNLPKTKVPVEKQLVSEMPMNDGPALDVVTRFTNALKDTGKVTQKQKELYSAARKERLTKIAEIRQRTSGEEGLSAELSALKGELPKADFEGVRDKFTQDDVNGLFDTVKTHEGLRPFETIRARVGLAKILDGKVPTPSELTLLGRVFPKDFVPAVMKHRSRGEKIGDLMANAVNLPRALMASVDLSAPFRQGVFLVGRKEFWKAWPEMFWQFVHGFGKDSKVFHDFMEDIRQRPSYESMQDSKLAISDLGHDLSNREEAFVSQWAERIPGVGRLVKASEHAYTAFLNKVRADVFDDIVERAGPEFANDPEKLKVLANYINSATGRGSLGKLERNAVLLNTLLFSPRLIASRVTLLNPSYYVRLPQEVRREAVRDLISFGGIASTVLGLAAAGGLDVEVDPRSTDFAKIKSGNTRFDILGGFQQYLRLAAQIATNEKKKPSGEIQELGKKYGSDNRLDVLTNFGISKASPVFGYIADYLRGKDMVGNEFDAKRDTMELFIPLFIQDVYKAYKEEGTEGLLKSAPGVFGVGVSTYGDKGKSVSLADQVALPKNIGVTTEQDGFIDEPGTPQPEPSDEPQTSTEAADLLKDAFGLTVTDSGVRSLEDQEYYYNNFSGTAVPGTSPHGRDQAVDIRPKKGVTPSEIKAYLTGKGYTGVKIITRKHGTGPHWHIEWDGTVKSNNPEDGYIN